MDISAILQKSFIDFARICNKNINFIYYFTGSLESFFNKKKIVVLFIINVRVFLYEWVWHAQWHAQLHTHIMTYTYNDTHNDIHIHTMTHTMTHTYIQQETYTMTGIGVPNCTFVFERLNNLYNSLITTLHFLWHNLCVIT